MIRLQIQKGYHCLYSPARCALATRFVNVEFRKPGDSFDDIRALVHDDNGGGT